MRSLSFRATSSYERERVDSAQSLAHARSHTAKNAVDPTQPSNGLSQLLTGMLLRVATDIVRKRRL